ncbi:MAG: glycosyltransferase family 4 protein [Phycisphaerae bacterium]
MMECARYLATRQHDITIFASDWEDLNQPNVHYHRVPIRHRPAFLQGPSFFKSCTRELAGTHFDVLNIHGCVCPTGGVHWVQSVHRAWLERAKALRKPLSLARFKQRINPLHPLLLRLEEEHFRQRKFQRLIATTKDVREDLHRLYDVPRESIDVVPNGFNPVEFNPERRLRERPGMREKLGLTPDDIALLLVANELDRKGYRTILSAMRELQRKQLRLIVCGRPDTATVKSLAAEYGLADQVIAFGPSRDVGLLHAAADLFVLPTQYEAFCLAILEALGSGLPVVTSQVPGAYDAIREGVNGYLVHDPKDGLELAQVLTPLLDPQRLAALSAIVPATATAYQWPVVLQKYEAILERYRNPS